MSGYFKVRCSAIYVLYVIFYGTLTFYTNNGASFPIVFSTFLTSCYVVIRINYRNFWLRDGATLHCLLWSFTLKRRNWTSYEEGVGCWRWFLLLERLMDFHALFHLCWESNSKPRYRSLIPSQFNQLFLWHLPLILERKSKRALYLNMVYIPIFDLRY